VDAIGEVVIGIILSFILGALWRLNNKINQICYSIGRIKGYLGIDDHNCQNLDGDD